MKIFRGLKNLFKFIFYLINSIIIIYSILLVLVIFPYIFVPDTYAVFNIDPYYFYKYLEYFLIPLSLLPIYYFRKLFFRDKRHYLALKKQKDPTKLQINKLSKFNIHRIRFEHLLQTLKLFQYVLVLVSALLLLKTSNMIIMEFGYIKYMKEDYSQGVNLPQAKNKDVKYFQNWKDMFITIDQYGKLKFNNIELSQNEFINIITKISSQLTNTNYGKIELEGKRFWFSDRTVIFLYGDRNLKMEIISNVFKILSNNGFNKCVLMAK